MRFYLSLYQSDDRNIMDDQNNGIMNFLKEDVRSPPEANRKANRKRSHVMPPFWWNVKQVTFLQYAIHEFKICCLWEFRFVKIVKIYLLRQISTMNHMQINLVSNRTQ